MSFINATILSAPSANSHSLDLESGSQQYASITDAAQTGLDITGDISMECWVKFESLPAAGGNAPLITKYQTDHSYFFALRNTAGSYFLRLIVDDGTGDDSVLSNALTVNTATWYHMSVTWDASAGQARFYQGAVGSAPVAKGTPTTTATSIQNSGDAFYIGTQAGGGAPAEWLDGLIDECRVWDDIRSLAEIQANYDTEIAGGSANLQGYWKLNNDYTDETANGNDLTATNAPVFSVDTPF